MIPESITWKRPETGRVYRMIAAVFHKKEKEAPQGSSVRRLHDLISVIGGFHETVCKKRSGSG